MLREESVRQNKGEPPRRWFADETFDLILWQTGEAFTHMQLCYKRDRHEYALVWRARQGFSHFRVDEGEFGSLKKASPMLVADGLLDPLTLRRQFTARSRELPPDVRRWVYRRLREFCQPRP